MVVVLRNGLTAIIAGTAVVIAVSLLAIALLLTTPLIVLAAILAPDSIPLPKRIRVFVADWVRNFSL